MSMLIWMYIHKYLVVCQVGLAQSAGGELVRVQLYILELRRVAYALGCRGEGRHHGQFCFFSSPSLLIVKIIDECMYVCRYECMHVCMCCVMLRPVWLGSLRGHPYDERVPGPAAHRWLVDGVSEFPGDKTNYGMYVCMYVACWWWGTIWPVGGAPLVPLDAAVQVRSGEDRDDIFITTYLI